MALIEINRNPSKKELLWFGALLGPFFTVLGLIIWFRFNGPVIAEILWIVGAVVTAVFWLVPPTRRPLYLGWMYAAFPIGWTVSHLLLAIIFYLAITPIALLMRLFGHDPMQRRFDRNADSYWTQHNPQGDAARYFRQF